VLEILEDWAELEALAQRFLPLQQRHGTPEAQAQTNSFLAAAALRSGQSETAAGYATEALNLVDEERWVRGHYLTQLAVAAEQQGDFGTALGYLNTAQGIDAPPAQKIEILNELHRVYTQQKDYLAAFKAKQQRRSVEQQYQLRAFIGAGRLESSRTVRSDDPTAGLDETETVALEITTSGRQQDLERLLERLTKNETKLLVLHGLSGVGKSSLVNGGLLPSLRQMSVRGQQLVPVLVRQYVEWVTALGTAVGKSVGHQKETDRPLPTVDEILDWLRGSEARLERPVLIFDQFEEFFFANPEPLERRRFFEFLGDCLNILPVKVMLSLREDYIHYLLECNRLQGMTIIGQDILSKQVLYPIGNLTPEDTKSTVRSMTRHRPYAPKPQLIDAFVNDLAGDLGEVRPIELQLVGAQLQSDRITSLAEYQALEGDPKTELVRRYLNQVVQDCGEENASLAELVMFLLTDERGTRPLKTRPELERELDALKALPAEPKTLSLVLKILTGAGMVVDLPDKPDDRYQLVHDYLAEFIRQQQAPQLEQLTKDLETERKQRLAVEAEKEILAKANKKARRRLLFSGVLLAASLVVAVVAVPTAIKVRQATANANEAVERQTEAEAAVAEANKNLSAAQKRLEKADEKVGEADKELAEAQKQLEQITAESQEELSQAQANIAQAEAQSLRARQEQENATRAAQLAQQQQQQAQINLATAEREKKAAEADIMLAREITALERESTSVFRRLQSYSSGPIGRSGKIEVLISALQTGKSLQAKVTRNQSLGDYPAFGPVYTLQQTLQTIGGQNWVAHESEVLSVSFSPDGDQILTGSSDGTAVLWSRSGDRLQEFAHESAVYSVSFSPDGDQILTGSWDGTAVLWSRSGDRLQEFAHESAVYSVSFSPDGDQILTGSWDGTAVLWSRSGDRLQEFAHESEVLSVSFSPDGDQILTGSSDGTAVLWSRSGDRLQEFAHESAVYSVSFSPDGDQILTGSWDGTAVLWSRSGDRLQEFAHESAVLSVSFSPDGDQILTGSWDGKAVLRDNRTIYELVNDACDWLDGYLRHNREASNEERAVCDIPPRAEANAR
ncbi:MAG: hypothetical protein F6K11_09260, partial [Leptolyngbya sp. SIO3F4]|nr:hypothetical protein [Leptolyngbya sp. SIO3F4]